MDLRSAQFESSFGITVLESCGIVGHSCYHCSTELDLVLMARVWVLLRFSFWGGGHSPVHPTYFYVDLCTIEQENYNRDATTLTRTWCHRMLHVKVHPPQEGHTQEMH